MANSFRLDNAFNTAVRPVKTGRGSTVVLPLLLAAARRLPVGLRLLLGNLHGGRKLDRIYHVYIIGRTWRNFRAIMTA